MRGLFSRSFMLKTEEMAYLVPTKGFSWPSLYMAVLFASFRCTHSPPPGPHFMFTQNLSPRTLPDVT